MKITLDLSQLIQANANLHHHKGAYKGLLSMIIPPFIKLLLEHTQGNKSAAARLAGFSRATLDRKIKHYHIVLEKKVHLIGEDV